MSRISTSVVVCAWTVDRWSQMVAALASALDQRPRPDQVVLVVDHCDDLLRRSAASLDPRVQVIASTGSRGLSGARNTGVAAATGEVVLFLDDDAAAHPGWLAGHVRHYEDPDVLGVGGLVVPAWADRRPDWFPPSSAGWWAARTSGSPPPPPRSATRSARTCRSAGTRCGPSAASRSRWVGSGPAGRAARRPRSASASPHAFPRGRILFEPEAGAHHHVAAERGDLDLLPPALLRRGPQQGHHAPPRGVAGRPGRRSATTCARRSRGPCGPTPPGRSPSPRVSPSRVPGSSRRRGRRHPISLDHEQGTPMSHETALGRPVAALRPARDARHPRRAGRTRRRPARGPCWPASPARGEVPADIVVSRDFEDVGVTTQLEDELNYSPRQRGVRRGRRSRSSGTATRSASTATASCSPRSCRSWTGRWSSAGPA